MYKLHVYTNIKEDNFMKHFTSILIIILYLFCNVLFAQEKYYTETPQIQTNKSHPQDPTSNIEWSAGTSDVSDIQDAFNNARLQENTMLDINIPLIQLPTQDEWSNKTPQERAFWLINKERIDREVMSLDNIEVNITDVAQYYSDYLANNNTWGHNTNGQTPWERIASNPTIGNCQDNLAVSENIAVFVSSSNSIPMSIERAVYNWLYDDAGSQWGHRHAILYYSYNDNSGENGKEGFLGIGVSGANNYQGPFSQVWNYAELIVMNVFDPCEDWQYSNAGIKQQKKDNFNIKINEDNIEINILDKNKNMFVEIFNIQGKKIKNQKLRNSNRIEKPRKQGVYFIRVRLDNSLFSQKIFIK